LHPGEGCINFPKVFDTLRLQKFSGYISLETSIVNRDGKREIEKLKKSLTMRRGMINNL